MYTEQQQQQCYDYAHLTQNVLYYGIYDAFHFIYSQKRINHIAMK